MIHDKWLNDYENLDNKNDNNNDDNNDDESFKFIHDLINLDTLHLIFLIIRDKWADFDSQNAADIFSLVKANQACWASETNSVSDEAFILLRNYLMSEMTLNFYRVSFRILQ